MPFVLFNRSFFVVYWAFVLGHCSIYECYLQQNSGSDAVHTPVFTPPSPARGGGGAQSCYRWGVGPDLSVGRGVVPRLSVSILGLPSGVAR
jgi:hypothetical protein